MVYKHQTTDFGWYYYPLAIFYIAMDGIDGPCIDGLPINNGDLPINNCYFDVYIVVVLMDNGYS